MSRSSAGEFRKRKGAGSLIMNAGEWARVMDKGRDVAGIGSCSEPTGCCASTTLFDVAALFLTLR